MSQKELGANKRDHKVDITDIAIDKVPFIKYREIPEEHYEIIQLLAKLVLEESRDNNDCNETAITYSLDGIDIFDEGGRCVTVAYGDDHSVDPMETTLSYHLIGNSASCVVVIIHNHPSLSKISLQDVSLMLSYASIKMIVAVTNLGAINYIVRRENFNRIEALRLFSEATDKYRAAGNDLKKRQEATDYFLSHCYEIGIIFDDK